MNRVDYLNRLRKGLAKLPSEEVSEILSDYEEHFSIGQAKGLSEEEVAKRLGPPEKMARAYVATASIEEIRQDSGNTWVALWRGLLAVLVLAPLNFFMLCGPFLVLGSLVFTGWVLLGTFFVTLISLSGFFVYHTGTLFSLDMYSNLSLVFMGLGSFGLGVLMFMGMTWVSKWTASIMFNYLKWNLHWISEKQKGINYEVQYTA